MSYPPIGDYALIGDCRSAALVSKEGSVDWLCFPRFDSHPAFGRILDWERGGHFRIGPKARATVTRRYLPETNVLETTFETEGGVLVLTDCMPMDGEGEGRGRLLRLVRCAEGSGQIEFDFSPRFDFGFTIPRLELETPHRGVVFGGADGLLVESEFSMEKVDICSSVARLQLEAGEEAVTVVSHIRGQNLDPDRFGLELARDLLHDTIGFWQGWSTECAYEGPYRDQVIRSALVLKLLAYQPTGAIVAAPTTSLPEQIGGVRNWDYRYTWLRDAAVNLYALFTMDYSAEAHDFMRWVRWTTAGRADRLQIMYGIGGERLLPEHELDLKGYRGSRPVRIGNRAAQQFQMDAYGYLLDTAWLYHRHGGTIEEPFWEFLASVADHACRRWQHPDHGIWEIRGEPQHFVSSKVFAWVAVDRAVRLAGALGFEGASDRWWETRDDIRREVLERGVDQDSGYFTQTYRSKALDASTLLLPLVRFVPADDPRMIATIDKISEELTRDGLVYRYRSDDGLPGGEGTFVICSFWLVDNLAMLGRLDEATALFERLCAYGNDLGLLAEEIDPSDGSLLGNFPQAFSHVGLVGAAMNIRKAAQSETGSNR